MLGRPTKQIALIRLSSTWVHPGLWSGIWLNVVRVVVFAHAAAERQESLNVADMMLVTNRDDG
jgi:hypothetical protein